MNTAVSQGKGAVDLTMLRELERKVLWLSTYMVHHANHEIDRGDGLKVGGHQASSASVATLLTALYFHILKPEDRVAVKPHAAPIFHAIQYLMGHQTKEKMINFRGLGGVQSYPSRTKDTADIDLSTGSVGLGVAAAGFASLVQDYLVARDWGKPWSEGRMVALLGDAELDEGNVYEALLEYWKHGLKKCWWIIDYNRQSLDNVVSDQLFQKMAGVFETMGWRVVLVKYGKQLQAAFARPGGERLRRWIDDCPNLVYSALTFEGGAAFRKQIQKDVTDFPQTLELIAGFSDEALGHLMTNLGGTDMEAIIEAFTDVPDDKPVCFIAYTIKGFGLPFQGHKDNHAGLMNKTQMAEFRLGRGVAQGEEWDKFGGLAIPANEVEAFVARAPFNARGRRRLSAPPIPVPEIAAIETSGPMSTQQGFGLILANIGRDDTPLASRIVTTSPDVTVSTNLGPWVNRRGLFALSHKQDVFKERGLLSPQRWEMTPKGQHIELGIAENNLFLLLAMLGLSHTLFGERLIPIGTLYDPFIERGLDALNYACYGDSRFILVATPSGITLAPEGGAHQSIATPLIGMAQDGLGLVRASLCRRTARDHGLVVRLRAARGQGGQAQAEAARVAEPGSARTAAVRSICVCRRGHSISCNARCRPKQTSDIIKAPTGCGGLSPARKSSSPTRARWLRKRSRQRACWPRTGAASESWRSPRPTGCRRAGMRRSARVKGATARPFPTSRT